MLIEIRRLSETKDLTLGVLLIDDIPSFTTAELLYRDNKRQVSAIPVGEYKAQRFYSRKNKAEVWRLNEVPNRSEIEIHPGNFPADTEGCILIGQTYAYMRGIYTIGGSRTAFLNFMQQTEREDSLKIYVTCD